MPLAHTESKEYLIRELDRVFSIAVRKKDADFEGRTICKTCDISRSYHWTELSCGHYRKRRHMATRWVLKNCVPQCNQCNIDLQGNDKCFEEYLEKEYGEGKVLELTVLSNSQKNYNTRELKDLIKHFKQFI